MVLLSVPGIECHVGFYNILYFVIMRLLTWECMMDVGLCWLAYQMVSGLVRLETEEENYKIGF